MKKLILTMLAFAVLCMVSNKSIGNEIESELDISLAPNLLKAGGWGVLTIVQIFKGEIEDTVELDEGALEQRALFGKQTEIYGWVDVEKKWIHRVQVYLIKPIDAKPLELKSGDFINIKEKLKRPLEMSIERDSGDVNHQ